MATAMVKSSTKAAPGRARAQDTDRHVGARMRERRVMLGLTQHQLAELIGVTYQQAHTFIAIPTRKHQDALCSLERTLAEPGAKH
jgi:DNA-binding XRE family transcriptional regulator